MNEEILKELNSINSKIDALTNEVKNLNDKIDTNNTLFESKEEFQKFRDTLNSIQLYASRIR